MSGFTVNGFTLNGFTVNGQEGGNERTQAKR
jgi:hypothetical protein